MSNTLLILAPFLILLILAVCGFAGCAAFTEGPDPEATTRPGPPLVIAPPDPPGKPASEAYVELVSTKTAGYAGMWPLNETGGNVANCVGALSSTAGGLYIPPSPPAGSTIYTVGADGLLFSKPDKADRAAQFDGTSGYIQVQFNGQLNPGKATEFSIELWVKPEPLKGSATQVLISSHRFDSATVQQGYEIALIRNGAFTNQQVRGRVFANGQMTQALATPQGDPSEWRHIVMTYEQNASAGPVVTIQVRIGKTPNTFKDGPHSAKYEPVVSAKPATLRFGAGHAAAQTAENFFAGRIDNIAIYNAKLDQTNDIDKHFAAF